MTLEKKALQQLNCFKDFLDDALIIWECAEEDPALLAEAEAFNRAIDLFRKHLKETVLVKSSASF